MMPLMGLRLSNLRHTHIGQFIGSFIALITGMAFHPLPCHLMLAHQFVLLLPQVHVFNGRFAGCFPTACFPACNPLFHALHNIFGIGVYGDFTRLF